MNYNSKFGIVVMTIYLVIKTIYFLTVAYKSQFMTYLSWTYFHTGFLIVVDNKLENSMPGK